MDLEELLQETQELLARRAMSRPQASALGLNVLLLTDLAGAADEVERDLLRRRFDDAIRAAAFEDLAVTQTDYAIQLASAPGPLIYEEMHKLLSLANEIHALRRLGFALGDDRVEELGVELRRRFDLQRREARMAAQDKVEDWNRGLWWIAENLASSSR